MVGSPAEETRMTPPLSPPTNAVVVGVDGTPGSAGALRYAAAQAAQRDLPLRVVHVLPTLPAFAPVELSRTGLRALGSSVVDAAADVARTVSPGLHVVTSIVVGSRRPCLAEEVADGQLLVLGRDVRRDARSLLAAHTATGLAARAVGPVVVVPSSWSPPDPADPRPRHVVVGVKAEHDARELLSEAFAEARRRAVTLRVVTAWFVADGYLDLIEDRTHRQDWEAHGERWLERLLSEWRSAYPDVPVVTAVVHGRPVEVLHHAGEDAELLMVARHRHALPSGHLGRTTRTLMRLSEIPLQVSPCTDSLLEPPPRAREHASTA
jgi:nucleotide-binding universal stress UspA family protein